MGTRPAGWIAAFFMNHAWLLSKLGRDAQDEVFGGRPYALAAGTITQPGQAEAVRGGHLVSGRWRFGSGIMHADWVMLLAFDTAGPLVCVVPVDEVVVHDTWNVPGMRATGSNDVETNELFVPAHRALPFEALADPNCPGSRLYDYPLLRYPPKQVIPLIHPAVAMGVADAAIDLFGESLQGRLRVPLHTPVIDEPMIHQTLCRGR